MRSNVQYDRGFLVKISHGPTPGRKHICKTCIQGVKHLTKISYSSLVEIRNKLFVSEEENFILSLTSHACEFSICELPMNNFQVMTSLRNVAVHKVHAISI
jgi:hypothetical protein